MPERREFGLSALSRSWIHNSRRGCFLTAASPNVQWIFYTVNKVFACKDDAGRNLFSLAITCQLFQLIKRKKAVLNCSISLLRRKASILAQNHTSAFFRPRQTFVYLTTSRGCFISVNLFLFHYLSKQHSVLYFFKGIGFGSAFHLVWILYKTILSEILLEGGEGSREQMERTHHHQFDFSPATWSTRINYSNCSFLHAGEVEWQGRVPVFSPPTPNWLKGLYLNNGSLSPVCSAGWCSSGCFFIVKLITQFLNAEPSQQAAERLARWLGCYLGVPELAAP